MNLGNCPRCGRLYALNFRDVCSNCIKEMEQEYQICVDYLRENKGANIQELSDATEVSIKTITKFIREGRISIENAPNMMYPCEVCGMLIREGHMCDSCRTRLTKDLAGAAREVGQKDNNPIGGRTYNAVDKLRN
ncbi:flagellar operon protein TIGR03826 [Paenibacillus polysaccharolyticus]|uniref:Flagellar operon protein TIGR03826 n=1 Tax=Paenibacillus polysaccharolyticus TaxID=582692 RepID=A0A1G5K7F4_9BACL|nr:MULTISPECIES: TIGR03826 family flagellar region protein [Paenibacillus]MDP9699873.1 flagellar operon protein (TIGR03826 family) [Paenibacillus intestini]SCY96030.1 flagellar operon protein TIGR03826 [Paenibacillus polysaccharolyticus]